MTSLSVLTSADRFRFRFPRATIATPKKNGEVSPLGLGVSTTPVLNLEAFTREAAISSAFMSALTLDAREESMELSPYLDDVLPHGMAADLKLLMAEMKNQNLDVIRFASYRTACKLRFIQKRTQLHLVDLWNMIEAFRENAFHSLEPLAEVSLARTQTLVTSVYYQLNKRLPPTQQVDLGQCVSLLLHWLLATYDPEQSGHLRVLSLKVSLSIMCAGKMVDKLRYLFSLLADSGGHLMPGRFAHFLEEALALPASVLESPTFHYTESLPAAIFDHARVTVNDFLLGLAGDHTPDCLLWMPLLHRLANVENVLHPVQCDGCNRDSFLGFRYKCQRCYNYQLCQDCFWRGRVSGSHTNQHEMKEYAVYKSPSKQLGHSLRKSFRCVPDRPSRGLPQFPDEPERTLDLAHIVPPSPMPTHNGFSTPPHEGLNGLRSALRQMPGGSDEEHRLIARYAARLARLRETPVHHASLESGIPTDSSRQRELVAQLEAKNREIMREIVRLRQNQEQEEAAALQSGQNPALLSELRALRQRKRELEAHLAALQDSRRDLMLQLEALMKMLKNHQASPRSTPNSSPRSCTSKSPLGASTLGALSGGAPSLPRSAPPTPGGAPSDSLSGLGDDVRLAFVRPQGAKNLRDDLLVAADSVTNAMSSLVRELHSGSEEDDTTEEGRTPIKDQELGAGATSWRGDQHSFQDSDQFLAELCLRNGVTAGGRRTGPVPVEETPQGTLPSPQQEPTLKDTQRDDAS